VQDTSCWGKTSIAVCITWIWCHYCEFLTLLCGNYMATVICRRPECKWGLHKSRYIYMTFSIWSITLQITHTHTHTQTQATFGAKGLLGQVWVSISRVRDLAAPMHLGFINWPFVPHVQSREPQSITEAPDGPQAYTLNILKLQEEGAQMCTSEWGQDTGMTKMQNPSQHY
jgi:hypothetical protein